MKETGTFGVLAYLVGATLLQVYLETVMNIGLLYYGLVGIIAVSEATIVGAYFMGLKDEPPAVRAIAYVGLLFITVLIISMVVEYVGPSY